MAVQPRALIGLGIGLAAAGAATAAGVTASVVTRRRNEAMETLTPPGAYAHVPDRELVVVADDGVPLHVEVDEPDEALPGAPTVVLSHGYCLNLGSWVLQRRALVAKGYRVVAWDQRSHGRSELGAEDSCTIEQLGQDLAAVVREVVPEGPIALFGHSMGGMTMMALAQEQPELVRERVVAAAFVATSAGGSRLVSLGFGELTGRILTRLGPRLLDRLGAQPALVARARSFGREFEDLLVSRYSFASPVPPAAVRFTADMIFGTRLSVMADFLPTLDVHDKRDALETFDGIETLVFNGDKDVLTPPSHSEDIVRHLPGAEHVVVADAGHIIMLEHADLLTEQLVALLDRAGRAAPEPRKGRSRKVTDLAKVRQVASARQQAKERRGRRTARS